MKKHDNLQTPPWVYTRLSHIDLDPCAGVDTQIGVDNWAIERGEDGLSREWEGFAFVNPPFSEKEVWIEKALNHRNGILLLPERGSAPWFGPLALAAGSYFVMGKKINFIGGPSSNNLGSVMFALGNEAKWRLSTTDLPGHFVNVTRFTKR